MKRVLVILLLFLSPPSWCDYNSCKDAIQEWQYSRENAYNAVRRLASCIGSSDRYEDCGSEFSSARSEYDDFESDHSTMEGECSEYW